MDLDAAADELYGISPDDFVARRTALVAEARKAGDRTLANEIGQLRKPTRTAWLVNLLVRSEADRIEELLELGRQLQEAQRVHVRYGPPPTVGAAPHNRRCADPRSCRGSARRPDTQHPRAPCRRSARPCRQHSAIRP